jgi:methylmalonyl-CoA mutase N-terminal domain/subunit
MKNSVPKSFATVSGIPVEKVYSSHPGAATLPGQFPYTRGIHESMYRERTWTMRQFSGFATAEETNARYRYLLSQGQTGLSVAFDLPTLMGLDSDSPKAAGEAGKCGVAVSTIEDMETLFAGIPLGEVSVSMTINSPAPVIWAMYLVAAERQGADPAKLQGTLQNDILKEYIAQKEYIYPPRPSLRLAVDVIEYATRHTPHYNPISISGYHIREAGANAVQELAFTLRSAMDYVEETLKRGLAIDDFAPRLSFFFNAHNDFFEEIAKYRAARRMWAVLMRDQYGARLERSMKLRFHAQTAGCSLTWQQPENNLVRTALQALAAVMGGTQSLHTNSLDEAYALPSEYAATLALRTQQVLASESGIREHPDPFGGSYFVETLTDQVEAAAKGQIERMNALGGMVGAIEHGFPQAEIARTSYEYQHSVETGERVIVGVNRFQTANEQPPSLLEVSAAEIAARQEARLAAFRARRDEAATLAALERLREACRGQANTMPYILDAVRANATTGEVCSAIGDVFGSWDETPHI